MQAPPHSRTRELLAPLTPVVLHPSMPVALHPSMPAVLHPSMPAVLHLSTPAVRLPGQMRAVALPRVPTPAALHRQDPKTQSIVAACSPVDAARRPSAARTIEPRASWRASAPLFTALVGGAPGGPQKTQKLLLASSRRTPASREGPSWLHPDRRIAVDPEERRANLVEQEDAPGNHQPRILAKGAHPLLGQTKSFAHTRRRHPGPNG